MIPTERGIQVLDIGPWCVCALRKNCPLHICAKINKPYMQFKYLTNPTFILLWLGLVLITALLFWHHIIKNSMEVLERVQKTATEI